jgi:hypothetical protein
VGRERGEEWWRGRREERAWGSQDAGQQMSHKTKLPVPSRGSVSPLLLLIDHQALGCDSALVEGRMRAVETGKDLCPGGSSSL